MKTFLLILNLILLYSAFAVEPDSLKGKKHYNLEGIRIVAETPKESIGIISIKPINKENLAKDINMSEAMKDISGVSLTSGAKGESNLRIRAFQKEDVKIMIDGRSVNGGYFGNVNLNEMPMFDIDEIQIVKGPVSSLFGFNSMGGTVNFITKKPSKDDWLKLSSVFKRNNTRTSKLSFSHDFVSWDYWLNITNNNSDGFMLSKAYKPTLAENGEIRNLSNFNNWDFQTKLGFAVFDYDNLGISGGYTYAGEKNIPNSIYENRYRKFTDWKRANLSALLSMMHSESFDSTHRLYYDAYNNRLLEFSDPQMTHETLNSLLKSYSLGYEGKLVYDNFKSQKMHFLLKSEKQYYNRQDNASYLEKVDNATYSNELSFFNILKLQTNLDFSYGSGLSLYVRDRDNKKYTSPLYTEFCGGFCISDLLFNKIILGFSKNIQYPSMHELFSESKGNINLNPEKAFKAEISVIQDITYLFKINTNNTFFYNNVYDMIEQKGSRYANIRNLKNLGIETNNVVSLCKWSSAELNYTYINLNLNNAYPYYEVPEQQVNLALNISLPYNIKCRYAYDYYTERLSPDIDNHVFTLKPYALHSFSLNKHFKKTKLLLSVDNLFDTNYEEEYGFPAAGINFSLGFETVLF